MTVSIPVSADAAAVVNAFRQIEEAIKRTQAQAKSLHDVDLSHPELKGFANDLQKAEQNLRDLERLGRGATATTMRQINREMHGRSDSPAGVIGLLDYARATERHFPDPRGRARHLSTVGNYILQGTRFAPLPVQAPVSAGPPAPPPMAPIGVSSAPPGAGPAGGAGLMGGMMGFAKMATPWALAAAGVRGVTDTVMTALHQAQQESGQNDTLYRTLRDTSVSFDELRVAVRHLGAGLQLTYEQSQRLAQQWAKNTNSDAAGAVAGARFSAAIARGYGIDPSAANQVLSHAEYLRQDPRRFALLIGDAVREGQMHGQVEQVMQALLSWTERATRLAPGTGAHDVERFAELFSAMNASNTPGLKGQAGMQLITQVDQTLRGGGGAGNASLAFIYRALGRNGITDPYAVRMLMQSGMFASPHTALGQGSDKTFYEMLRAELDREYGAGYSLRKADAFGNLTGKPMPVANAMMQVTPGQFTSTNQWLNQHRINLGSVNLSALPEIAQVVGPGADLEGWRKRLLGMSGADALSDKERGTLTGAGGGEDLRLALVRVMASHGMQTTEATRMAQGTADLSNALTAAGTGLIPVVTDLKGATADLARAVAALTQKFGQGYDSLLHGRYVQPPGGIGQPRLIRSNNPVGLNYAGQKGALGSDGRFAVFPDMATGVAAAENQYLLYQKRDHLTTVRQMVLKATPRSENPHVDSYIANVAADLGVSPDQPIDMSNPHIAEAYINAVSRQENGHAPDAAAVHRGVARALRGGGPAGTQTPAPPAASGQKLSMDMRHQFAPLQIDITSGGRTDTHYAPVTTVGQPSPIGIQ